MASSSSTSAKPTLLSLPDDTLGRIFNFLTITDKYTLQSSVDGINLASTNSRLRRIFSAQLTHITPLVENADADTFSLQLYKALLSIAGENLRELNVPECHHPYLYDLPNLCPNLEALQVLERYHISNELSSYDTDNDEDGNGANDQNEEGNDSFDDDLGDGDISDPHPSENEAMNGESSEINICGNEGSELNIIDSDTNGRDNDNKTSGGDDGKEDDNVNQEDGSKATAPKAADTIVRCPIPEIIPRLNLRKLSVIRLPRKLCTSMMNLLGHSLEELHLHKMRKHQLPLLVPLLSHHLKALTVTTNFDDSPQSERVSKLIDALTSAVLHIPSVTVHIPGSDTISVYRESASNIWTLDFPDEAASLISSARRNSFESECTKIDLAGDGTYPILSSVDRNASISLTNDKITVRDHGEGMHITSIPLYDEFLDVDLTHLEEVYMIHRSCMESDDFIEHGWDPEWGHCLTGQRLERIRCCDANALNVLGLSTRILEFFVFAILNTTDWSCLKGVEELYLLGPPGDYRDQHLMTIESFLESLPGLIDAFRGGFICIGFYPRPDFRGCSDPESALEYAHEAKDAIERYVRRGGDAATVRTYVDAVIDNLKTLLEGI